MHLLFLIRAFALHCFGSKNSATNPRIFFTFFIDKRVFIFSQTSPLARLFLGLYTDHGMHLSNHSRLPDWLGGKGDIPQKSSPFTLRQGLMRSSWFEKVLFRYPPLLLHQPYSGFISTPKTKKQLFFSQDLPNVPVTRLHTSQWPPIILV